MKKRTYISTDLNEAAILNTVDGINLKTLSFELDLDNGDVSITYHTEYLESLQPVVDRMLWQYRTNALVINEDLFRTTYRGIQAYQQKKINELLKMNRSL